MLGKPHWFKRRKYGGWGLFPKTWQGLIYVIAVCAIFAAIQFLPLDAQTKMIVTILFAVVLVADVLDIMRRIPMDERERLHEALSERNALWAIIATLTAGIAFQAYISAASQTMQVDPIIIIALLAGVAAKAATNIYLDRKN